MQKRFRTKLDGDAAGKMETASFTLPFDSRKVWGKARVPVTVTINQYSWRSTVGHRAGRQYIVVNGDARRGAGVKAGDVVAVTLEPDRAKRDITIPPGLRKALGAKLSGQLAALAFTHKKEFVRWYTEAKKDETRARRIEKMKHMLTSGKVIT